MLRGFARITLDQNINLPIAAVELHGALPSENFECSIPKTHAVVQPWGLVWAKRALLPGRLSGRFLANPEYAAQETRRQRRQRIDAGLRVVQRAAHAIGNGKNTTAFFRAE